MAIELGNVEKLVYEAQKSLSAENETLTNSNFINSVFSSENQETENTSSEKAKKINKGIFNIIQNIVDFGIKHAAIAQKDVKNDAIDINNNSTAARKKASEIEKVLNEFSNTIEANTEDIKASIKHIEKLSKNNKIKEEKDKITEELNKIETAKADLNSSDPEKRNKAIETIQTSAQNINTITENITTIVTTLQTEIENQSNEISSNINSITEQIKNSTSKITEGITEISKYMKNTKGIGVKVKANTAKGIEDKAISEAEKAAGSAASSNIFTASTGAKLTLDGSNREIGSTTRITESATNLKSLISSIGNMGKDCSEIASFSQLIGGLGEGVLSLADLYKETTTPLIESIGSLKIDEIQEANTDFQSQISNLFGSEKDDKETNTNNLNKRKEDQTVINNKNQQNSEIDTTKLKKAFGI